MIKIYKELLGYVVVQGQTVVGFTDKGEAFGATQFEGDPWADNPQIEQLDINTLDKAVAGNILKTMYWRLSR